MTLLRLSLLGLSCWTLFVTSIKGSPQDKQSDVAKMDISKAFDRVDYELLVRKLYCIDFPANLVV